MKKIFKFSLVLIGMLVMSSCKSAKDEKGVGTEDMAMTIATFDEIAKADFKSVKDTCPSAVFYESQITFTANVDEDSIEIKTAMNVIQAEDICYQFYHEGTQTNIVKMNGFWLEDRPINLERIITLDSAIVRLQMADIVKPKSKMVTLRKILGPTLLNPSYIFGQRSTGFVKVDALNGSVDTIK